MPGENESKEQQPRDNSDPSKTSCYSHGQDDNAALTSHVEGVVEIETVGDDVALPSVPPRCQSITKQLTSLSP